MAIKIQGTSLTQKHEINALMIIAVKEAAYEVAKRKPEKIWDLSLDLCDTGAALLKSGTIYVV